MNNFEKDSSKFSSLLTFSLFAILLFAVLPFLIESEEILTPPQKNTISMDFVVFQESVSLPLPEEELIKSRIVELTEPESVVVPDEPLETLDGPSAGATLDFANQDSSANSSDESEIHSSNPLPPIADKDIIVSQLASLIEQNKEYSIRAQQRGIEGIVIVEITLSEECIVTDFMIIESESSLLDNSVEDTIYRIIGIDISEEILHEPLVVAVPIEFMLI